MTALLRRVSRTLSPSLGTLMRSESAHVHSVATSGFAEGTNDLYDRARPSYPASVLQYIHKELDPTGGKTVLEIGSGTGIFSRLLLQPPTAEYPSFDLGKLVAVEPSAGMRAAWDRGQARLPASATANATTVDGGFDDLSHAGITKGIADAVIIAQAWHWCPDYDKALREIASYLRPDTPLFLVWNLEFNADPWHRRIRDLYQPLDLGSPQYYRGLWKAMFDTNAYKELYEPVHDEHLPWDMGMNEDQLVDRLFSKSYLTEAHLNGDKRVQFEKELRKAIQEGNKEWIDKEKGIFKYKYVTDVYVLRRK